MSLSSHPEPRIDHPAKHEKEKENRIKIHAPICTVRAFSLCIAKPNAMFPRTGFTYRRPSSRGISLVGSARLDDCNVGSALSTWQPYMTDARQGKARQCEISRPQQKPACLTCTRGDALTLTGRPAAAWPLASTSQARPFAWTKTSYDKVPREPIAMRAAMFSQFTIRAAMQPNRTVLSVRYPHGTTSEKSHRSRRGPVIRRESLQLGHTEQA